MNPKTLLDAVKYFSDLKICFEAMLPVKWPDGKPTCPKCGGDQVGIVCGFMGTWGRGDTKEAARKQCMKAGAKQREDDERTAELLAEWDKADWTEEPKQDQEERDGVHA